MATRKKPVRDAVLDAAIALVEETGAGTLTLDAVAARAGVSKGGLLHHFRSRDALLTAMVARIAQSFEEELSQATARLNDHGGDRSAQERERIATYLDRSFSGLGKRDRSAMALLTVAATRPALLGPLRSYFRRRTRETMATSPAPLVALALMALADGLWVFDALGIPPLGGKLREQVREAATQWAHSALDAAEERLAAPRRSGRRKAGAS